jgi:hypothetical protein
MINDPKTVNDELVTLRTFTSEGEATWARGRLAQIGVKGVLVLHHLGGADVYDLDVPPTEAVRALRQLERDLSPVEPDEPAASAPLG